MAYNSWLQRLTIRKGTRPKTRRWKLEAFEQRVVPTVLGNPYLLPGDTAPAATVGTQNQAQIARGDNGYLAVWTDTRSSLAGGGSIYFGTGLGTMTDIYAARLDNAGQVIDTTPIIVTQAEFHQKQPKVAWNGQNYLVAWSSEHETDRYRNDILAARVAPDGTVLDATPFVLLAGTSITPQSTWSVTSDGTNWVALWQGLDSAAGIYTLDAARVSPTGTVLDPGGKVLRHDTFNSYPFNADIAFAGDEYLVSWIESNSAGDLRAQRFNTSLDPLGNSFTINSSAERTAVATNGTDFFITWSYTDITPYRVFGKRVSHAGVVLDANAILVANIGYDSVDVTWDGTNYIVAYEKTISRPNFVFDNDIFTTRVSPLGIVLDPAGIRVKDAPNDQIGASIAPSPAGGAVVVWNDDRFGAFGATDVFSTPISATLVPGIDVAVNLGAPRQQVPRMAAGSNGFLTVFVSETSGQSRVLAERLGPTGTPLDPEPLVVTTNGTVPSVAWNGSEYLAVWTAGSQIYSRRIAPNGTFLDVAPVAVMAGFTPDVAAMDGTFLVTANYAPSPEIQVIRAVRVGTDGVVLGAPVQLGFSFDRLPRVEVLGNRWLVVWQENPNHDDPFSWIEGAFVNGDGTTAGPFTVSNNVNSPSELRPALAASGNSALIVWEGGGDLAGRRITADGSFLDGFNGFAVSSAPEEQFAPAVAWDGTQYVVTWIDQRNEPFPMHPRGDIYAARVSAAGVVFDPTGFAIANSVVTEETPEVASAGGTTLYAYTSFVSSAPYANLRLTFRASTPLRVADMRVDDGSTQRSMVRSLTVTFSGQANISPGAVALNRIGGGPVALNVATQTINNQTVATLTFADGIDPGSGSLSDGRYSLTIFGNLITDGSGDLLDGDGDGTAGGNFSFEFHRLFGDADGNAAVNSVDFAMFRMSFGVSASIFDFNGDGQTNSNDFTEFRRRFGVMI